MGPFCCRVGTAGAPWSLAAINRWRVHDWLSALQTLTLHFAAWPTNTRLCLSEEASKKLSIPFQAFQASRSPLQHVPLVVRVSARHCRTYQYRNPHGLDPLGTKADQSRFSPILPITAPVPQQTAQALAALAAHSLRCLRASLFTARRACTSQPSCLLSTSTRLPLRRRQLTLPQCARQQEEETRETPNSAFPSSAFVQSAGPALRPRSIQTATFSPPSHTTPSPPPRPPVAPSTEHSAPTVANHPP